MKIFNFNKIDNYKFVITIFNIKIKFKIHFYEKILIYRINRNIKSYKYVHVMHNDKFNKSFVDFLNSRFNSREHVILCKRLLPDKPPTVFPRADNVFEFYHLDHIALNSKNIKKIIFHEARPEIVDFLYENKALLEKSYWLIWGGDLYRAPRDEKNDYVRSNFKGYLCVTPGDKNIVINKYLVKNNNFYNIKYPLITTYDFVKTLPKYNYRPIHILAENSSCQTTLELLDMLKQFKDKNIIVYTVLSYGDLFWKDKIIKKGKEIFDKKFCFLDKMMPADKYAIFLKNMDVFISNVNQQSSVGNIEECLCTGAKIFLLSGISTYNDYRELGFEIFDTRSISTLTYEDFIKNDSKINPILAKKYISDEYKKMLWEGFFSD